MFGHRITRRSLLAGSAAALGGALPGWAAEGAKRLPVGLELYSVREELAKDAMGTVRVVAAMGYEVVEFYAPYHQWTPEYARDMRKLLDELNVRCLSTHNSRNALEGDGLKKAIELNQLLGSKTLVLAYPGQPKSQDEWKEVATLVTQAAETLEPLGMRAGYHNHQAEFIEREGFRPMPFLAASMPKSVTLQFDVGTCVHAGYDPVAWINANPGRIRSLHLKDWGAGAERGYKVLFGEGDTPWKALLDAAEQVGGAESYLIEQEGSRLPPLETAKQCLANFRKVRPKP
jgi:sugar phosphate isomerase/epimerase